MIFTNRNGLSYEMVFIKFGHDASVYITFPNCYDFWITNFIYYILQIVTSFYKFIQVLIIYLSLSFA